MTKSYAAVSGLVNVLKPPGMTSQDVVSVVRRVYNVKKAGHSGTLDPEAAGVLPVFVGDATRLIEYAGSEEKCYRAELTLGAQTDTGDDTGTVVKVAPVPALDADAVEAVLARFRGPQQQVPPRYSALKVNGKKLYEYARAGQDVEIAARPIEIYELHLVAMGSAGATGVSTDTGAREADGCLHSNRGDNTLTLDIRCSKGTYVRTLLEDIAVALGSVGTMTFLLRTRAGQFALADACTLEDVEAAPDACLLDANLAVRDLPRLAVTPRQGWRVTSGVRTTIRATADGTYALEVDGTFCAVVRVRDELVQAEKVLRQVPKPENG